MRCTYCGYQNLLNPHEFPHVTDRRVLFAANRASDNGRRWYTGRQVFGEIVRKRRLRWWTRAARLNEMDAVVKAVDRLRLNGWAFQGLIVGPMLERSSPVDYPEPDLFDYGAERILVVDDEVLVDLFVRNGVHTGARTIIISTTGYPHPVVERAASLVRDRTDVPVHVLHASNLTVEAMASMARALLTAPELNVLDIGLSPVAARRIPSIRWARRLASIPVDSLPHRWLTTGLVEALTTGRSMEELTEDDEGGAVGDFG